MIKKVLLLLMSIIIIQIIVIACCPEPKIYFTKITDISLFNFDIGKDYLGEELADSTTINQENYRIRFETKEKYFTHLFYFSGFFQNANALDCYDTWAGLKSDIVKFEITCNKDIWNIKSGNPIEYDKFSVYFDGYINDSLNDRISINEWLIILNTEISGYEWFFEFKDEVNSIEYLKFKMLLVQEDGTEFEAETNSIKIE